MVTAVEEPDKVDLTKTEVRYIEIGVPVGRWDWRTDWEVYDTEVHCSCNECWDRTKLTYYNMLSLNTY